MRRVDVRASARGLARAGAVDPWIPLSPVRHVRHGGARSLARPVHLPSQVYSLQDASLGVRDKSVPKSGAPAPGVGAKGATAAAPPTPGGHTHVVGEAASKLKCSCTFHLSLSDGTDLYLRAGSMTDLYAWWTALQTCLGVQQDTLSLNDFEPLAVVGSGAFGKVLQVRDASVRRCVRRFVVACSGDGVTGRVGHPPGWPGDFSRDFPPVMGVARGFAPLALVRVAPLAAVV